MEPIHDLIGQIVAREEINDMPVERVDFIYEDSSTLGLSYYWFEFHGHDGRVLMHVDSAAQRAITVQTTYFRRVTT